MPGSKDQIVAEAERDIRELAQVVRYSLIGKVLCSDAANELPHSKIRPSPPLPPFALQLRCEPGEYKKQAHADGRGK